MTSSFNIYDLFPNSELKHSVPITPFSHQLLDKYRIKTLHKTKNLPKVDVSLSIREIEGLKSTLIKLQTPHFIKKIPSINNTDVQNISILSKNFTKDIEKSPMRSNNSNEGLFWLNNKMFAKNVKLLNEQKQRLIGEKNENFRNKTFEKKRNELNKEKNTDVSAIKQKKIKRIYSKSPNQETKQAKNIRKIQGVDKENERLKFSPFSRRFIREKSPIEIVFVMPPKNSGKNFFLNF